jgi:(1->4)-alpha-D-glucan 1-alpha-D-glucosylmutase
MLTQLQQHAKPDATFAGELAQHWEDGRIKLYAIWKALNFRQGQPELFSAGDFLDLKVTGPHPEHVVTFLRHHKREWALLVAPRWLARINEVGRNREPDLLWHQSRILLPDAAPRIWKNIFTGEKLSSEDGEQKSLAVSDIFLHFPVALLRGDTVKSK